jgi:hypothetical protein
MRITMDKFIEYDDLTEKPLGDKAERLGEFLAAQRKEIEENYIILERQENIIHENQRTIDDLINRICDLERKVVIFGKMASYVGS